LDVVENGSIAGAELLVPLLSVPGVVEDVADPAVVVAMFGCAGARSRNRKMFGLVREGIVPPWRLPP
jgi:hypothetical protein